MITQIEIDGFKTFKDFKVDLAPFQVIVGPNGSGKSNLFDALHLLSRLAEDDLATAFQDMRGRDFEQFTNLREGKYVDKIRLAVEMLVDRKVRDDLGKTTSIKYTRLRYEVDIIQGTDELGLDRLFIAHESLVSIPQDQDNWSKKYVPAQNSDWIPVETSTQAKFIDVGGTSTIRTIPIGNTTIQPVIFLFADSDQDEQEIRNMFHAKDIRRTVLSSITNAEYPHAFVAREELRSLRFLHLNPEILRRASPLNSLRVLGQDGSNLPTTLARIQSEDKLAWSAISLDLANVVPDLTYIELRRDKIQSTYTIWAHYQDGRSFSSRVLSDGTLQILALVALKNDPQFHGILCFEEPENGIHPTYLKDIAFFLKGLTTDFTDLNQIDEPLKQVLVTTHSPAFISQTGIIDSLLFMYTMTHVEPESSGIPPLRVTRAVPVTIPAIPSTKGTARHVDMQEAGFTLDKVIALLTDQALHEALDRLEKSRSSFEEI